MGGITTPVQCSVKAILRLQKTGGLQNSFPAGGGVPTVTKLGLSSKVFVRPFVLLFRKRLSYRNGVHRMNSLQPAMGWGGGRGSHDSMTEVGTKSASALDLVLIGGRCYRDFVFCFCVCGVMCGGTKASCQRAQHKDILYVSGVHVL